MTTTIVTTQFYWNMLEELELLDSYDFFESTLDLKINEGESVEYASRYPCPVTGATWQDTAVVTKKNGRLELLSHRCEQAPA